MRNRNRILTGEVYCFAPVVRGENSLTVRAAGEAREIELIGTVGKSPWDDSGISEKEVRDALKSIPVGTPIKLKINSEGGSVQEGLGIYNAVKERREDITACVQGYALSIASVIPLAAGKVISPRSAIWMMHETSAWSYGNKRDKREDADMLGAHDETLVDIYHAETGKSKAEVRAAMEATTWIKGGDAVDWGLADEGDEEEVTDAFKYRPLAEGFLSRVKVPEHILNCIAGVAPGKQPVTSAGQPGGQPTTKEQTVNKKAVVALLKKHGIEASETETEEQLQAKLETIPVVKDNKTADNKTADHGTGISQEILDIRAELAAQKRQRIMEKVNGYVDSQQITKEEVPIYIEAMLKDEAGTIKILDAKPAVDVGGEPVGFNRVEGGDRPALDGFQGRPTEEVVNLFKVHTTPAARYEAFKAEWPRLLNGAYAKDRSMGLGVRNENTFAAGITTNFLIMGAITKLGPQVAMLRAFSKDNSVDPYKPLATGIQKFNTTIQDGSDTQMNATDFTASSDSTLTGPAISVNQYTQGMHLTNAQLNSGVRMADLIEAKLGSFKSKIAQVVTAPITVANFSTLPPLVINSAAFSFSDAATLQGLLKKSPVKNLILDGTYIARLANTPGFFQVAGLVGGPEGGWKAFGWDFIGQNTEWQEADPYVQGFACNPQAIGIVSGLPLNPLEGIPGNVIQVGVAQLPGPDIAIATYLWMDANARTMRATYDIMLGAVAVDMTAGAIIKSQ